MYMTTEMEVAECCCTNVVSFNMAAVMLLLELAALGNQWLDLRRPQEEVKVNFYKEQ